ncbi:MAG: hypothetical protein JSV79_01145 [Armatimonadota bacterium]|nr:MAG: hypothetical protein JSV79_01145 [Armatimonadota bacterium]
MTLAQSQSLHLVALARRAAWPLSGLLLAATAMACEHRATLGSVAETARRKEAAVFTNTEYPRIAMFWSPVRGDRSLRGHARHDLIVTSEGWLGLEPDREPRGLADGFTPESVQAARKRLAQLRELNPDVIVLCEVNFYEYHDRALPEDHPWWLRVDGEKEQFWPGTHRMDWYNPQYREHVVKQTAALEQAGVDGVYYDNLRNEPEPWIALLKEVRNRCGDDFLILSNYGYAIDEYDFAAPYLNGVMYESGFSHHRTEWDDTIAAMRHTASLLKPPTISCIERFEDIEGRSDGPLPKRRRPETRDPQTRRWSMCYALIVADYYYLFSDNTFHGHDWYPEYDVKIGLPKGDGERLGSHVWRREYEKALVVMNLPGAKEPYEIEVERPARDSFTGDTGTRFTVPPGDGCILLWEE